jgi:hypothetical protein
MTWMARGVILLTGWVLILSVAGCDPASPVVPAEVVNVPQDACVAPSKRGCNSDKIFVKKEWVTSDCQALPIGGFGFRQCSVTKIYRFSFPGRGTADMQSYGAMLAGAQESIVANYTKEVAGQIAGVVPMNEATLTKGLQGGADLGNVVGRMDDDFEFTLQQRMITNGKIISHTGDTFVYAFDSGNDHCKAFLSYGPVEWPGYIRRWAAGASICNHAGRDVGLDEISKLQSQLVFR